MNETEREKLKERINQYIRHSSGVNIKDMIYYMGIDFLVSECQNVSELLCQYPVDLPSPIDILVFYAKYREHEDDISWESGITCYMDELCELRRCGRDEYDEEEEAKFNAMAELQCEIVVCVFRREIGVHFHDGTEVPDILKFPKPQWEILLLSLLREWHKNDISRMTDLLQKLENGEVNHD
jgi:hypothetical protein